MVSNSNPCHIKTLARSKMARVVFFLIGCLLTVTAGLKLWMLMTDPFADIVTGFSVWVLWFGILCELLLVSLLLSPVELSLKIGFSFVLFGAFFIISISRSLMGFENCGCAGVASFKPWVAVVFNGSIIAVLYITAIMNESGLRVISKAIVKAIIGMDKQVFGAICGAGMVLLLGVILSMNDTSRAMFSYFIAKPNVQADSVNIGKRSPHELMIVPVVFRNASRFPVTITGSTKSCVCISADALGKTIPPFGSLTIDVAVKASTTGRFRQRFVCFLDFPLQPVVAVDIFGFWKKD